MAVSIKEIAALLGLSTATVSRALSGNPHVLPETREKVLAAAGDDRPRPRRSSAETRGSGTFLVLAGKLTNPLIVNFIEELRAVLGESGYRAVVTLTDFSAETECDAIDFAERSGFSGIFILNVVETPALLKKLKNYRRPVVLLNKYLHGADADVVITDNYRCGYSAGAHLVRCGHRCIGHIAGPETSVTCHDRTHGFLDAMREHGIDGRAHLMLGDRTFAAGERYGEYLLSLPPKKRPTAVFSATGVMASGLQSTLRKAGLSVPEDLSIIISDDYSQYFTPYRADFTGYGQDAHAMAQNAADLILKRLSSPGSDHCRIVLPTVLTEAGSVKQID